MLRVRPRLSTRFFGVDVRAAGRDNRARPTASAAPRRAPADCRYARAWWRLPTRLLATVALRRCAVIWHSPCLLSNAAMSHLRKPAPEAAADAPSAMNVRLRGTRLRIAWAIWLAAVACGVVLLIGFEPFRMLQLQGLAADNVAGLGALGLSPGRLRRLPQRARPGTIRRLRRRRDRHLPAPAGHLAHHHGVRRPDRTRRRHDAPGGFLRRRAAPEWRWFALLVTCAVNISSITALVLLPDGRFVPRYTGPLTAFWAVGIVVRYVFFPQFARPDGRPAAGALDPGPVDVAARPAAGHRRFHHRRHRADPALPAPHRCDAAPADQVVRVRRRRGGGGHRALPAPGDLLPALRTPGVPRVLFALVGVSAFYVSVMMVPVTLAFALAALPAVGGRRGHQPLAGLRRAHRRAARRVLRQRRRLQWLFAAADRRASRRWRSSHRRS